MKWIESLQEGKGKYEHYVTVKKVLHLNVLWIQRFMPEFKFSHLSTKPKSAVQLILTGCREEKLCRSNPIVLQNELAILELPSVVSLTKIDLLGIIFLN